MGRRGKEYKTKDDNNTGKESKLSTDDSPCSKNVGNVVAVKSCGVTIDRNCWLLAEEALKKTRAVITKPSNGSTSTNVGDSKSVTPVPTPDKKAQTFKGNKKKSFDRKSKSVPSSTSPRRSPRKLSSDQKSKDSVVRRRQETLKKVSRALGSVRRHCAKSKKVNPVLPRRKSLRIKKQIRSSSPTPTRLPASKPIQSKCSSKNSKTMERNDRDELNDSNCDDSSNHDTNNQDDGPGNEDLLKEDSDDDPPMQVLERQDQLDDEEEEEDNGDISLNLANDTDEESLLLSPSALPASSLFRSPSRKKSSEKKKQRQQPVESFFSSTLPSPEPSTSPVPSTSSGSSGRYLEKRGRGRPRKPIEDVKSVSGKLYRKKMADRLAGGHGSNQPARPRAHTFAFAESVMAGNFDDADEDDEEEEDEEDMMEMAEDGAPNYGTSRLKKWDNKSTFVYAKHKFVSNENKFRCDTCQVSFTALSSLKRHYGTIYHKQQEAAGGNSTLDLRDILRPDRHNEMPSTSAAAGLTSLTLLDPSSSLVANRRGHGRNRPGELARTSSFVRRNAVDNIKKKYNAAADARRRKENSSMPTSTVASWYQIKHQQRKRKKVSTSNNTSSNFWFMDGDSSDDNDDLVLDDYEIEDIENNFPNNDDLSNDVSDDISPEPKKWLSNSWRGNGSPHFSCEVCNESFSRKLEFTAHLYNHRQEEQRAEFFTCADCDTKCANEDSLDVHCRLFVHSGSIVQARSRKFPCPKCGSIFPRREYFQKHILTHKRPMLRCPHCPMQFEYKFYLCDHIKADHDACATAPTNTTATSTSTATAAAATTTTTNTTTNTTTPTLTTNIPTITVNGKPKVELLSTIPLVAENSSENRKSETENIPTTCSALNSAVTNHKSSDLPNKRGNKSETKQPVPKFITCEENGDESSRCSDESCEPPPHSPIQEEGLSLMQKFLDSQNSHDHTYSDASAAASESESLLEKLKQGGHGNNILNGSITTENGNQELVIQFEPDKQPIFSEDFLEGTDAGAENAIFSPLTIEIPRDTSSYKERLEVEELDGSLPATIPESFKTADLKSRTPNINNSNSSSNSSSIMQLGGLLGCGAKCVLPEKIPENSLTCQDCGKAFEHRKSLVKHVQYYRQNEEYSCLVCNKGFRLKHHVSRHMKSFHNIDTNSTTSSTSGDQQGDGDDQTGELDHMMSSPGGSSGGLLAIPSKTSKEVSGAFSGSSFTRQFTSDEAKKRKFSSVKSVLTKMRSLKGVRSKSSTATSTIGNFENGSSAVHKNSLVQRGSSVDAPSSSTKKKMPGMLPLCSTSLSVHERTMELNPEESYTTVFDSNGATAYKCLLCKKLYPSKHRLNSHLWYHKKAPTFKCNICGAEFKFKHDLNAHKQVHKSDRIKFSCDKCPKAFSWRKDLLKHTRTKHNDDGIALASSSETFSGGPSLLEDSLSRCPFCPLVFPEDVYLSSHISENHGKCFVCGKCRQVLGSQELLNEHMEQEHDESHPPTPSPYPSPIDMMDEFNEEPEDEQEPSSPEFELPELN